MHFSDTEKRDLIKAWVVVSLAVVIADLGGHLLAPSLMVRAFVIYALTVGVSLLAHEVLGHKFLAQRFGLFAEFRADDLLLMLSVVFSFMGFVFIVPGAVLVSGATRIDTYGKVAAAGPLANIILALIFSVLYRLGISLKVAGVDLIVLSLGVNAWFGLFNMLPLGLWDGAKVMAWNKYVWLAMTATATLLYLGVV